MSYMIALFIFSLFVFINIRFIRAFNETCGIDKPPCSDPLKCFDGYCLCSRMGKATDGNSSAAFWTGDQCIPCPLEYSTSATKLISDKDSQMNWDRARDKCQDTGGDLLVIRSDKEYNLITANIKLDIEEKDFFQRIPQNATYFASIWIGARLANWSGDGTYNLVSNGPALTKNSYYWCSQSSPLGQEPSYVGLKQTGEREECVALAIFASHSVCMHDWFCSWDSYLLCEIHPPPPRLDTPLDTNVPGALEEKSDDIWIYVGIGGIVLVLVLALIVGICCICKKKKNVERTESTDSAESGSSEN